MNAKYHCKKNPELICSAASLGCLENLPCDECNEHQKGNEEKPCEAKIFIVTVNCYYLKDTQILCPENVSIPTDAESNEHFDIYTNNDNWKNFRQDAYLGYYKWPATDVEGLKRYIAKKRGLDPAILEAFPVEV